jgi:CelD/BcsL family acetyltransferase involved in cellulose biosynthesis
MTAQWIDPLSDPRWSDLVDRHPRGSVFHTRGWLEALQRTYGYQPAVLTTAPRGVRLRDGIVFCRVKSWLTGQRLVSLPFSDHCDPLVDDVVEHEHLMEGLCAEKKRWKYVELRPTHRQSRLYSDFAPANSYYLHRLDLRPEPNQLLSSFHYNHVVRKIRRAEREKLDYQTGRSDAMLRAFYQLLIRTRSRHGLPPQPFQWFKAILDCMPEQATVRLVLNKGIAVASMLTLRQRDTMVYKYGASDDSFHPSGGVQLLFWRTIQDARAEGCMTFDLGRSATSHAGLIAFKDHWAATRSALVYRRYPCRRGPDAIERLSRGAAQHIFTHLPDRLLVAVGRAMYRHIG